MSMDMACNFVEEILTRGWRHGNLIADPRIDKNDTFMAIEDGKLFHKKV